MAKRIIVDVHRCLACRSCELACALAAAGAEGLAQAVAAGEALQPRVRVTPAGAAAVPLQCRHCDPAPCEAVCPKGALARSSAGGAVLLDRELCTGCRFCMLACPYGVIEPARDGKVMVKCDLCLRRAEAGLEPACVAACPTGALRVEELDEALEARRRDEQALVAARHARHAAPQDPAQKSATCEVCGRAFAPAKQLQLVRKKAGDAAVVPNVCPPCRRAAAAEALARAAAPAPEGEANPRETTGE